MSDIAQNLEDTFSKTLGAPFRAASGMVDKIKQYTGIGPGPDNKDTSWHDNAVKQANESFVKAAQKPAPTPTPKPKPKAAPTPAKKPSYKEGTDYVPETGHALLHKGEAVLKKEDADKYREAKMTHNPMADLAEDLGGKGSGHPKKEIDHMKIRKSKTPGRHIIEHHHTHPMHHPMEEHTTSGDDELASHVLGHMGEPNPGEAEADAGQSGIPAQVPGAAAGAPNPPSPVMA